MKYQISFSNLLKFSDVNVQKYIFRPKVIDIMDKRNEINIERVIRVIGITEKRNEINTKRLSS